MSKILDYAKDKDGFINNSQVKSGIRFFRDSSDAEIREYFRWLADKGYGVVRGSDDALEFSVN